MTDWTFIAGITEETTDTPLGYNDQWTHDATALAAGQPVMMTMRIDAWGANAPWLVLGAYRVPPDNFGNPDSGLDLILDGSTLYGSGYFDGFASLPFVVPGWAALILDANGTDFTVATFAGDPSLPGATPTASAGAAISTPFTGANNYRRSWGGATPDPTAAVSDGFGFYSGVTAPPPPPPPPAPQPHIKAGPHRTGFLRH